MVKQFSAVERWAIALLVAFVVTRLISLGLYPLYDTTEARYGEIARIMFETRNWVTPQFDYNVPFWGKPPLHTWLSAGSFMLIGVSEFSARLPHLICGVLTLLLVYLAGRRTLSNTQALAACLVLASSLGFILAIGMVMTDAALLLCITLAMVSYWQCFNKADKNVAGHLFFVALALGMLAKGPVAVVLVGIPLVLWSLSQRCLFKALAALPWLTGMLLFLVLTLPWYIWAEIRTPGFLEYFLWGEHVQRFLVSGWEGDLYGSAHDETKGTIWLFWLAAAFPWSGILIHRCYQWFKGLPQQKHDQSNHGQRKQAMMDKYTSYLLFWMLSPMLLFTLAGNILPAYVLPGFSAMALLTAKTVTLSKRMLLPAGVTLVLITVTISIFSLELTSKTAESALLGRDRALAQDAQIYYWKKRPFSAQFYSKGQAQHLTAIGELNQLMAGQSSFYLAMSQRDHKRMDPILTKEIKNQCKLHNQSKDRLLLKCNRQRPDDS